MADVASQPYIIASRLEYVVDERCSGGLAVAAGYTYHLGVGIAPGKLYLADDVDALLHDFLYHRGFRGYTGALDDLIGVQNQFLGVVALLPGYAVAVQQGLILILYVRHVGHKDVKSFLLGQHGGSCTALAGS